MKFSHKAIIIVVVIIVLSLLIPSRRQSIPLLPDPIIISLPSSPVSAQASTTSEAGVVNFTYQNSQIEFQIPLQKPNISNQNDTLTFSSSNKDVEIKYQILPNGVKEDIILNRPSTTNQFSSKMNITNSDIYKNSDDIFVFYDSSTNKYLYHFQKPYAIDASGVRTDNVTYQLFQNGKPLTQNPALSNIMTVDFGKGLNKLGTGNDFTLVVTVDSSWLSHPSRTYPITIDPTLITDPYDNTNYINTGASSNYQVTSGTLSIGTTSSCWATSGFCNSSCSRTSTSDGSTDLYTTYVSPSSCTGFIGTTGYAQSCSTNGSGNCYLPGNTAGCSCLPQEPDSCSAGAFVYSLSTQCTWITPYKTSALVQSTNLLVGATAAVGSIDAFQYTLPSLPSGTSVGVKFSQNASTWYSSSGGVGASNALTVGTTQSISLSSLAWTGANFYYQLNFLSTGSTNTPVLNEVSVVFSTIDAPSPATNCLIQKSNTNSYLNVIWNDNATNEDNYEIQRSLNSGAWTTLSGSLSAGTTAYQDNSVSSGNTYQYRVAPYVSGPTYAAWCTTPSLSLFTTDHTGGFRIY